MSETTNNITTTQTTRELAPGLLRNTIDERIVRIRPMSTPIDQISRCAGARGAKSMVVEYYSVDTKATSAKVSTPVSVSVDADSTKPVSLTLHTDRDDIFETSETLMLPGVWVHTPSGKKLPVQLYVTSGGRGKSAGAGVECIVSSMPGDRAGCTIDAVLSGQEVVRMGRAAAELDVQTPQFAVLPRKASNYCQIFKMQVEQSTMQRIIDKEVGWNFSDQEEAAIIDMRMGMEKNFLFGCKARITDPEKGEEVLLTGGVWNQTDNEFAYDASAALTDETLVKLCRQAFSHNAGSSKKVLLAGSELIEKLHLLGSQRVLVNEATVTKWGLDFTEIHSKFGTLYVMLAEVFDHCGRSDCGMVIDPEYITKYCHVPFRTERLNLRTSGVRNTEAVIITECSCVILRYPQSHMRIVAE